MEEDEMSPALFVDLMKQFYKLGWMSGSGGGMACASPSNHVILYSPSSVQKERLKVSDLFILNSTDGKLVQRPLNEKVKESACTPVFNLIINMTDAGCVIHSHSKFSNLLTQIVSSSTFDISDQEMIKGVLNRETNSAYSNIDRLVVPIIENAPFKPAMKETLTEFPSTCGVLVRNHGFFCWGPTWQRTKIMTECYEYLFELACSMIQHNIPLVKSIII
ncbi:putative methylthioribulose-1-phosphate dehydratase [Ditylenchus destructor]|uniref:Methylthioribulose-1-phosphate dehydratase n=1 Tax=Ditylenchus destructor TaxID=166010 RepID=A0AAD4NHG8_9BILA|nr:putative methylthioribulose-1-phosphate dehydratase [Ditylenchus destructor]